jgi:hypothetical protein
MNLRRLATLAPLYQRAVLPACIAVGLAAVTFGPAGGENTGVAAILDRVGPSLAAKAEFADKPEQVIVSDTTTSITADPDEAINVEFVTVPSSEVAVRNADPIVTAALTNSAEMLPPEPAPADVRPIVSSVEVLDECFVPDACIDRYLWVLYQRTPKEDSIKESERRKVTIKRKGKVVSVTRTFTKLVDENFAWKDPKAADKAGMSMMDYVIGGMDRSFKLKLFRTLRAAEAAGLAPGITSAFRDDYRQSIASGLKAANDRSYHGGSFRGGYGHGLAADIVSVGGATRAQRWTSTESLWKWVDARGKEFGIARPYLDRDPPHVAPIDGQEYADHNRVAKVRQSRAEQPRTHEQSKARAQKAQQSSKKPDRLASRGDRGNSKRRSTARSSRVRAT